MRLTRVDIFGFKSFYEKTSVVFRPGITAVIGPNGCGKSNLVDAILWALGEQRPKSLRSERMEDVLFNGTETQQPINLAQVALIFEGGPFPEPYASYTEVAVTRTLFRSGESDYLINKNPCRLKDIRDFLADIAVGYKSHAIIEQGKVEEVLSASPIQRRALVEETAGISKYRIRREEALRKLVSTESNLIRVRDVIGEVKKQVGSLDRQAKRAERYKKLKSELKDLDLRVASSAWRQLDAALRSYRESESGLLEEAEQCEARLSVLGAKQAEMALALTVHEQELSRQNNHLSSVESQIQKMEGNIERIRAERVAWEETRVRLDFDSQRIHTENIRLIDEEARLRVQESDLLSSLSDQERRLADLQEQVGMEEHALSEGELSLNREKESLFDLTSRLLHIKSDLERLLQRRTELMWQRERYLTEEAAIIQKQAVSNEAVNALNNRLKTIQQQCEEKSGGRSAATVLLKQIESALGDATAKNQRAQEEATALATLLAGKTGFYRGWLTPQEDRPLPDLPGLQGMIADAIEVPAIYEKAVEGYLESRLRGLVVKTHDAMKSAVAYLKERQGGRGTFFPEEPRPVPHEDIEAACTQLIEEGACPMLSVVSYPQAFHPIAQVLFLGVMIVDNLDEALAYWARVPMVRAWCTLQGDVVDQSGTVTAGEWETSLLAQKREMKQLEEAVTVQQATLQRTQDEMVQYQATLQETRTQIERLTAEIQSLEMSHLALQKDSQALALEQNRLQQSLQTLLFEKEGWESEEKTLFEKEEVRQVELADTTLLKEEKETKIVIRQEEIAAQRAQLGITREARVQRALSVASLKESHYHIQLNQERVLRSRKALEAQIEEQKQLQISLEEKLSAGILQEREAVAGIEKYAQERASLQEGLMAAKNKQQALQEDIRQITAQIASERFEEGRIQKQQQEVTLKKMEAKMAADHIQETIHTQYQISVADHVWLQGEARDVEGAPETEPTDALAEAREKAAALRQSIETLGPVNLLAIEEYQELNTRHQFLTGQETDLTTSIESLRQTINKIDETTMGLFVQTFHLLNEKFETVFSSFFGGGTARLILLDEANPLESGVDIIAQPPGKRSRNPQLLSGGEKALTAISLLFGIFLVHPSPFCILDEIDAPLDEENTRRFAQTLQKMSAATQFIIVTHNKHTMQIADVLYGVTMEQVGLSKIVSVSLSHLE